MLDETASAGCIIIQLALLRLLQEYTFVNQTPLQMCSMTTQQLVDL